MDKFRGKYRISTFRANWWNYGNNGYYFITITTQNFMCYFGEVINKQMFLNETGKLVNDIVNEIPKQFDFAKLGSYVVMPNHIHLIIEIDKKNSGDNLHSDNVRLNDGDTGLNNGNTGLNYGNAGLNSVDARLIAHLQNEQNIDEQINPSNKSGGITGTHNPMLHENIPRIIRWLKGRTTFEIRKFDKTFKWQSLYYDVIIRDEIMHRNITFYIENNPAKWDMHQRH